VGGIEHVATFSAPLLDMDQAGGLEPLEMASGRGPRVAEPVGELACGHRAASGGERHEDVTAMLVGQRTEDGLELV
jgi:hypothetical protein